MRERILAVVGAVALVVVAVVVRQGVLGGGDMTGRQATEGSPVVACAPALTSICDDLARAGRIAADPPVLDLGETPDEGVDGWITWDPAPALANLDTPQTWGAATALGSAELGILATTAGVPAACATTRTWSCLGDAWAGGSTAVGVGEPDSAGGLARIHPLAAALVPDGGDFTQIPASSVQAIVTSPAAGQADLEAQITTILTARGALTALVGPLPRLQLVASRPGASGLRALAVTPPSRATVVVTSRNGRSLDPGRLAAALRTTTTLSDLGLTPGGTVGGDELAGDLYQVRLKAGTP